MKATGDVRFRASVRLARQSKPSAVSPKPGYREASVYLTAVAGSLPRTLAKLPCSASASFTRWRFAAMEIAGAVLLAASVWSVWGEDCAPAHGPRPLSKDPPQTQTSTSSSLLIAERSALVVADGCNLPSTDPD